MNKVKKLSILVGIILVLSICLAGCGEKPPLEGDAALGSWTMTSCEYQDMTLSANDLKDALSEMPSLEINEDGSAVFTFNSNPASGSVVKNEDGTYTLTDSTESQLNFSVDDGILKLDYEEIDMVLVFEKKADE